MIRTFTRAAAPTKVFTLLHRRATLVSRCFGVTIQRTQSNPAKSQPPAADIRGKSHYTAKPQLFHSSNKSSQIACRRHTCDAGDAGVSTEWLLRVTRLMGRGWLAFVDVQKILFAIGTEKWLRCIESLLIISHTDLSLSHSAFAAVSSSRSLFVSFHGRLLAHFFPPSVLLLLHCRPLFSPSFQHLHHSARGLSPPLLSYFGWPHLSLSHSLLLLTSRYLELSPGGRASRDSRSRGKAPGAAGRPADDNSKLNQSLPTKKQITFESLKKEN